MNSEIINKKSIIISQSIFNKQSNTEDYVEVTEWANGDGFDISIYTHSMGFRMISLTLEELDSIKLAEQALLYNFNISKKC